MELENAIKNLKEYIKEDVIYNSDIEDLSDFDKFCINHCKDIKTLIDYIEKGKIE